MFLFRSWSQSETSVNNIAILAYEIMGDEELWSRQFSYVHIIMNQYLNL